LWFALNEVEITEQDYYFYREGHPQIQIRFPTLYFYPKTHGSSWLYVLDVPIWNGDNSPEHGELVDLSRGPNFVSKSSRVLRQKGGLVFGDVKVDSGDLSKFYVCAPMEISCPFKGTSLIDKNYKYFFPPPEKDILFDRLLNAPLVPDLDDNYGFKYKQSLDVYIISDSPGSNENLSSLQHQTEKMSMLSRLAMRTNPETLVQLRKDYNIDPEDATYFQIDVPFFTALPNIEMWNQSILQYGLSKFAQPQLLNGDIKLPMASLENVIIELSPLETAFLSHNSGHNLLSAIWIFMQEDKYLCTFFLKMRIVFLCLLQHLK